jgi:tetratricopeptide (TPR) repeat protein
VARPAERLSRKELKQRDPLAQAAQPLTATLERNWKRIAVVVGVVAVVVTVTSIVLSLGGRKREQAAAMLGQVLAESDKPVVGTPALPEADPKQKASEYFNTEQEKQQAVANKAKAVAERYPGTPAGSTALLAEGDALYRLGSYPQALQSYDEYLKKSEAQNIFRAYAELGRAYALLGQGKMDEAVATARELADHAPGGFGRDLGLLAEGRFYQQAGQLEQAKQAYRTLKVDFSETTAGREASERLTLLGEASAPPASAAAGTGAH